MGPGHALAAGREEEQMGPAGELPKQPQQHLLTPHFEGGDLLHHTLGCCFQPYFLVGSGLLALFFLFFSERGKENEV